MAAKLMGRIVQEVSDLSSKEKLVLIVLANYFNTDLDEAFPSQETIARNSSLSRSSVNRALDELQNKGYITKKKRRRSGQFSHNVYKIHLVSDSHKAISDKADERVTMCQASDEPCVTGTQYPLDKSLNDPLSENCQQKSFSGPPKTVEQFWECTSFQRRWIYLNRPNAFASLESQGLEYDYHRDHD
ncbi:MAG: helix-turn-helix domain-containing protein [Paracoccaceae bacterium]